MTEVYRDTDALLATEMRGLAEDERYIVVAVRIEKATILRNVPALGAVMEIGLSAQPE